MATCAIWPPMQYGHLRDMITRAIGPPVQYGHLCNMATLCDMAIYECAQRSRVGWEGLGNPATLCNLATFCNLVTFFAIWPPFAIWSPFFAIWSPFPSDRLVPSGHLLQYWRVSWPHECGEHSRIGNDDFQFFFCVLARGRPTTCRRSGLCSYGLHSHCLYSHGLHTYIGMACIVMACIVMAHIFVAYTVMPI